MGAGHPVFVYGTLKRGFPNHKFLDGARLLGPARTVASYPMLVQGRYFSPALLPEAGSGHRIMGELWEVDDAKLAELDGLETTHLPTGYIREMIDIERDGVRERAWTYFKPRDRVTIVHSEPLADYQDRRYVPSWERR